MFSDQNTVHRSKPAKQDQNLEHVLGKRKGLLKWHHDCSFQSGQRAHTKKEASSSKEVRFFMNGALFSLLQENTKGSQPFQHPSELMNHHPQLVLN